MAKKTKIDVSKIDTSKSATELAAELNVSLNYIYVLRKKHALEFKKSHGKLDGAIFPSNKTLMALAKEFGVSKSTICRALRTGIAKYADSELETTNNTDIKKSVEIATELLNTNMDIEASGHIQSIVSTEDECMSL